MRNYYLAIGAMSGTSADGIDISLIKTDGLDYFEPLSSVSVFYDNDLKEKIINFSKTFNDKNSHFNIILLEELITHKYIEGIKKLIKKTQIKLINIDVIGVHGQTIFHDPQKNISLQLINSNKISDYFKIKVISNFRQKDIINGGEGAPLVPIFHAALKKYINVSGPIMFINIGGISNITYISNLDQLIAFDTGPGMCLLDDYVSRNTKHQFDSDGNFSKKGIVDYSIIKKNLSNKFFNKKYPKSLDRNYFSIESYRNLNIYDACATISMFTTISIYQAITKIDKDCKSIYLMGGGSRNLFILENLSNLLDVKILSINSLKLSDKYIESQAFAYLGVRSLKKLPISYPKTTGVRKAMTGGEVF
ncbi:anhydro-N-acetylmuramic acid kinase [Pelagibacteraceae bacterium]|nr:anhydro-N-acetylmuramic acid kinase [Pelagibacteraceae bacterium]